MKDVDLKEEELLESNNEIYKCPGCGANLKYNSTIQGLHCSYCDYQMLIDGTTSNEEFELKFDDNINEWKDEVKKATCSNCSANIIVDKNLLTCNCPFCNTPMVISSENIIGLKPNRVIPFKISNDEVLLNYKKWVKKRFLVPRKLKKDIPNPSMYTVYVPSWTFDSNVITSYKGRLGKRYTTTVGSGKNRTTVTHIRYFRISGIHQKNVDDLVVMSGKNISQDELNQLLPFNTNGSYLYDNRYIIGHTAEHYSINLKDGWKIGQGLIEQRVKREILNKYSYDVIDYFKMSPTYNNSMYKYVILPVWICHYDYHKKTFKFLVNGETGKVTGKSPISIVKLLILCGIGLLIIILISLIYFYM